MSLETLLEAAKYIEYRSEAKARGEVPKDYDSFISFPSCSSSDNNNGSGSSVFLLPPSSYSSSSPPNNDDNNSSGYYDNDSRDRRRTGGAGTREVHNKLEKNRRAHLKKCFESLKKQIPNGEDKKTSNLGVLRSALKFIHTLTRKEREYELEKEGLSRTNVTLQKKMTILLRDLPHKLDHAPVSIEQVDINTLLRDRDHDHDSNSNSTSTASECGPLSDVEDEKNSDEMSQESVVETVLDSSVGNKDANNGSAVGIEVKPFLDANNKSKSLALLAKSAEVVSLASIKVEPSSPPRSSAPKAALAQSAPVTIRAIQPHPSVHANKAAANSVATVGEAAVVKVEPGIIKMESNPQRTTVSAQVAVPQSTIATNGNAASAPPTAIKMLAPQTVRILAPVLSTTSPKTLAMATSSAAPPASTRVALAASGITGSAAVGITALALGKSLPAIKRVAALAPVQVASSSLPIAPPTTLKGVLTTGSSHGSIAVGQLALKPNNLTQPPMLTATAVNFQATSSIATTSPSATTVARQLVTATMKPVARSQVAQITQVMAPTTLVSSVGPVIQGGPSMNPIVAPMSVMSPMNRATVAQVIAPSQLSKVMGSSFIKTVPIYQQQLFPHMGTVPSQTLVNPIVMVTTSNVVPATTAAQVTLPGSR